MNQLEMQLVLQNQRKNYIETPTKTERLLSATSVLTGKYAKLPLVLDASHWNQTADKHTSVNWKAMKAGGFVGGYVKLGEVLDNGDRLVNPQIEDTWFDDMFEENMSGLLTNNMWTAPYLYLNTGWAMYMSSDAYDAIDSGITADARVKSICEGDPNIHLIVRRLKIGAGRVFDYSKLKGYPTKPIHAIVIDVEKGNRYDNNAVIPDYWQGKVTSGTVKRLQYLMDQGYLPQVPILVYSAEWFITKFGNKFLRTVLDFCNTICAGYYYNYGNTLVTIPEFITNYLEPIPNTWSPPLFGGAVPGKTITMLQISGDRFAFKENPISSNGTTPSLMDINVYNGTLEQMKAQFPAWKTDVVPPVVEPSSSPSPSQPPVDTRLEERVAVLEAQVDILEVQTSTFQILINEMATLLAKYKV